MTGVPQTEQFRVEIDPGAALQAFAQHRRRFADAVRSFDDDVLSQPTRCSEWSVADVLRHCRDVDEWCGAGASGQPTVILDESFDPTTTPHEFVVAQRAQPGVVARDRFVASSYEVASELESAGPERWNARGASPVQTQFSRFGVSIERVPWWLATMHHFMDSFVHERDVLIPLGIEPPQNADETVPLLTYTLAISGIAAYGPIDVTVAGIRVVCSGGPVVSRPIEPRPDVAPVIDALMGRGNLRDVVEGVDRVAVRRLSRVGRFLAGGLR